MNSSWDDWPNREEIFKKSQHELIAILEDVDIKYNRDEFEALLEKYKFSSEYLLKDEYFDDVKHNWKDNSSLMLKIWDAILAMWIREFPDKAFSDRINSLIQRGYGSGLGFFTSDYDKDLWLEAWAIILQLVPEDISSIREADEQLLPMEQSLFNWCQDLVNLLTNQNLKNPDNAKELVTYTEEFMQRFPDTYPPIMVKFRLSSIIGYQKLGNISRINNLIEEIEEEHDDDPWAFLHLSDLMVDMFTERGEDMYYDNAEKYLGMATKVYEEPPNDEEKEPELDDIIEQRLKSLKELSK